jgi:hypothetical protein
MQIGLTGEECFAIASSSVLDDGIGRYLGIDVDYVLPHCSTRTGPPSEAGGSVSFYWIGDRERRGDSNPRRPAWEAAPEQWGRYVAASQMLIRRDSVAHSITEYTQGRLGALGYQVISRIGSTREQGPRPHGSFPHIPIDEPGWPSTPWATWQSGACSQYPASGSAIPHSGSSGTLQGEGGFRQVTSEDPGRQEWFDLGMAVSAQLRGLDPVIDGAIDWLHTAPMTPPVLVERQLVHTSLDPDHLLVDPATGSLLGVIDWTDACLGDAGRDFVNLVTWRGWGFAEEVLALYPRRLDSEFRSRLRWMSQWLSVIWLAHVHEQGLDEGNAIAGVRNAFAPNAFQPSASNGRR